ncbi:MAG: hypothetical protein AAF682_10100 [Planctomycetota bacterium]
MNTPFFRRSRKLIKPRLQLRLTAVFLGISVLCFLLQLALVGQLLAAQAASMPSANIQLLDGLPMLLGKVLLISLGVFAPLLAGVGIAISFRIAGPVYNFERYLLRVAEGEETAPCTLREDDELKELCDIINEVTEPLRKRNERALRTGKPRRARRTDNQAA